MDNELNEICLEIFKHIISQITIHLRFMDLALDNFQYIPNATSIECDGKYLSYNPIFIIKTFKNNPRALTHGYLHIVMHAIFRHQFLTFNAKANLWNLACDIAVENMILELDLEFLELDNTTSMKAEIAKIKNKVNLLTAQKIYHYLKDELNNDQIKLLSELFYFDDHSKWCNIREIVSTATNLFGQESKDDPTTNTQNQYDEASHETMDIAKKYEESDEKVQKQELSEQEIKERLASSKQWQEIGEKISVDLETFSKEYGAQGQSMVQSLKRLYQEKYNYTTFLRKFMSCGEKTIVNEDEFDYIYYTLGLNLYHNMPLIEALEYKEAKSLKDLVIAIDTSGSVSGEKVQAFLQKTYNIFSQKENFFHHFNIHIIQCDAIIQNDTKITNLKEFDNYITQIEIQGFGGTDFRPVFDHLQGLINQKELPKLAGLLYFTDGDGTYPKTPPEYPVAFIFLDDLDYNGAKVPPWAIKYVLDESEIINE